MVEGKELETGKTVWMVTPVKGKARILFNLRGKVITSVNEKGGDVKSIRVVDARTGHKEQVNKKKFKHLFLKEEAGWNALRIRIRMAAKNHMSRLVSEIEAAAEFDAKVKKRLQELEK